MHLQISSRPKPPGRQRPCSQGSHVCMPGCLKRRQPPVTIISPSMSLDAVRMICIDSSIQAKQRLPPRRDATRRQPRNRRPARVGATPWHHDHHVASGRTRSLQTSSIPRHAVTLPPSACALAASEPIEPGPSPQNNRAAALIPQVRVVIDPNSKHPFLACCLLRLGGPLSSWWPPASFPPHPGSHPRAKGLTPTLHGRCLRACPL